MTKELRRDQDKKRKASYLEKISQANADEAEISKNITQENQINSVDNTKSRKIRMLIQKSRNA